MAGRTVWIVAATAAAALALGAPARAAFNPAIEALNFSKTTERFTRDYSSSAYQLELRARGVAETSRALAILAKDPERDFLGSLCWNHTDGCAGDVRFYDWQAKGAGLQRPVLFTARNGSTISGRVWATRSGPAHRPGIVITNGSVQAPEQLYAYAAATLAKRGYVVLTWDPQGQGQSDTFGEGVDALDGVPSQAGGPFYDGTEDALDFFFSTPSAPYRPRRSCSTGTDHSAKQRRRVARGLDAAYNPFWSMLDRSRVGIAGHSLGAGAVSYVGQRDPRVKAIVAWDNLSAPTGGPACASAPATRGPVAITKPALGMSVDYGLTPQPNLSEPNPQAKNAGFAAYSAAGVDSAQLNIRGGTHYEFSFIPNPAFGATLRGMDMAAWYTGAWFDRYVKGDPSADRRLLTQRWRDDAGTRAIDPMTPRDGNMFSFYLRSPARLSLAGGGRFTCADLRAGCSGMVAADGEPPNYSYLAQGLARDPLVPVTEGAGGGAAGVRPVRVGFGRLRQPIRVRRGAFRIRCRARGSGRRTCTVRAFASLRGRGTLALGSGRATIRRRSAVVAVRLTRRARRLLARRGRRGLRITLTASLRGPGGQRGSAARRYRLVAARS